MIRKLNYRFDADRLLSEALSVTDWPYHQGKGWAYAPLEVNGSAMKVLSTLPYTREVLNTFDLRTKSVLSKIYPHKEAAPHCDGFDDDQIGRFHIAICGSAPLLVGDEAYVMLPGELWLSQTGQVVHSVKNNEELRIHLIVNCRWTDSLRSMVGSSRAA